VNLHQDQKKSKKYISLMSDDLKKDLAEFEGQITEEIYMKLLEDSYANIANLRESLGRTQTQEVGLRDQTAALIYPSMLIQATSAGQAAEDSYRAADVLMRVRESGVAFSSDIIKLLKEMRDSVSTDLEFGRLVRRFLTDK